MIGRRAVFVLALLYPLAAHAADMAGGGPKKSIAVGGFGAVAGQSGEALSAMLTAALLKDPRFVVVERQAMGQIEWEQKASQAGLTTAGGPQAGQLIGASVLIKGDVTKFDPGSSGGGLSVGGLLGRGEFGGLGIGGSTALVEISLRLIDTATGQVIASDTARGTASASHFDASLYQRRGLNVGVNGFSETPLGQACEVAIEEAVRRIDIAMNAVPWSSTIVDNDGENIFVGTGSNGGMQTGTVLHVSRKVRDLTDPATGAVLETITSDVGTIRIDSVHEKVSVASFVSGTPPQRGDIVKLN